MRLKYLLISVLGFCSIYGQSEVQVFNNGDFAYRCFRIPAIIKAPNGNLLAFAEGRKKDCDDFGDVDIVHRLSTDNGATWQPLRVIVDFGDLQAGNSSPVVDNMDKNFPGGRIFLFYNTGNNSEHNIHNGKGFREVKYITSVDDGKTWSKPVNITTQVHKPKAPEFNSKYNSEEDWRTYANGPGHALQIRSGKYAGRIIVPANHSEGVPDKQKIWDNYFSHTYFSDDNGKTFKLGESVTKLPSSNEATVAEISDGKIMLNMRLQNGKQKYRGVAISSTGGETWDTIYVDKNLVDPVCQASLLTINAYGKPTLVFSNPASQTKRELLTLKFSEDDGMRWSEKIINLNASAYSDLVEISDNTIGVLFEKGNDGGIYFISCKVKE